MNAGELFAATGPRAAYRLLCQYCRDAGGAMVGLEQDGHTIALLRNETSLLLLGPPRSGKSSAVLASLLTAPGPVVCVTTKNDLYDETHRARATLGPIWHFSPTGADAPAGAEHLRWSPITQAKTALLARQLAYAMVGATRRSSTRDGSDEHFRDWAQAMLAAALFVAHHTDACIDDVVQWITEPEHRFLRAWFGAVVVLRDLLEPFADEPRSPYTLPATALAGVRAVVVEGLLAGDDPFDLDVRSPQAAAAAMSALSAYEPTDAPHPTLGEAVVVLDEEASGLRSLVAAVAATGPEEYGSIISTSLRSLAAYTAPGARRVAQAPNFDAAAFFPENFDAPMPTLYVTAGTRDQRETASLVCGLLDELHYTATETARRRGGAFGYPFLYLLLDECANIAPLPELPSFGSYAGGSGICLVCAFQDLGQANARWPQHADTFPSLFQAKLILRGVAHRGTLEALSQLTGEQVVGLPGESHDPAAQYHVPLAGTIQRPKTTTSVNRQFRPILTPAGIAKLPAHQALYFDGPDQRRVALAPLAGRFDDTRFIPYEAGADPPFWHRLLAPFRAQPVND